MRRRARSFVVLAVFTTGLTAAAGGGGCGFVAGVDFFELERAAPESAADADNEAAPAGEAGGADATPEGACVSAEGCASFDDCAQLDAETSRKTAVAGVVLEVNRTRAHSAPCSLHAELPPLNDATKRTSAFRATRNSPKMVRTTLDFWFYLERIDATPATGGSGEGRTQLAVMTFTIPPGAAGSSGKVRTLLSVGPTKAYLTGDDGATSLALGDTSSAGLVGGTGWHHAQYIVERTSSATRARFDAKVTIDGNPFLAGDVEVARFETTTSIEALVGVVESTARTSAPSVFIDDVRLVTMPPS